jgi:hypothetical protein
MKKKNQNWDRILLAIGPYIKKIALEFSANNPQFDNFAFEDAGYDLLYRHINQIARANGDLDKWVKILKSSARREMCKLAGRKKDILSLDANPTIETELTIPLDEMCLDRKAIADELYEYDSRLGVLFAQCILGGKRFDNAGDKSYLYRGIKRFAKGKATIYRDSCGRLSFRFYCLFGS